MLELEIRKGFLGFRVVLLKGELGMGFKDHLRCAVFIGLFLAPVLFADELYDAFKSGSPDDVTKLIKNGANVNSITVKSVVTGKEYEDSPIAIALGFNPNIAVAKILVKAGANVNGGDAGTPLRGNPLLQLASSRKFCLDFARYQLLFDSGADPLVQDGGNALQRLGRSYPGDPTPAEAKALTKVVQLLLDKGLDPNSVDDEGDTPLLLFLEGGSIEIIKLLLAHGAQVNVVDKNDQTPLTLAAESKRSLPFFKLLVDAGADIHAKDHWGMDAAHTVFDQYRNSDPDKKRILKLLGAGSSSGVAKTQTPKANSVSVSLLTLSKIRAELALENDVSPNDVTDVKVSELIDSGGPVIQYKGWAVINFSDHEVRVPFLLSFEK